MKSIFFSVQNRRRNLRLFQSIKEFIEHQEGLGNKVLLPKLNEEIIIVNPKDTNVIKIYSIKLKMFVREFLMTTEESSFGEEFLAKPKPTNFDSIDTDSSPRAAKKFVELAKSGIRQSAFMESLRLTKGENYSEFVSTRLKKKMESKMRETIQQNFDSQNQKKEQDISLLEVSPNGKIIVSVIGPNIFIKILNITSLED